MEDSDLISDDPERLLAEQARARRYAILVEGLAITGGIAAIILAFWVSTMKPVRTTGFYVAIGASVGTALVLVGVLLRIQRAIAARLDATKAAVAEVQMEFTVQIEALNQRMTALADLVAPEGAPRRSRHMPPTSTPVPSASTSVLVGQSLIDWLQRRAALWSMARTWLAPRVGTLVRKQPPASGKRVVLLAVLVACAFGMIYGVIAAIAPSGRDSVEQIAHRMYPQSELAATYVASSIRASCHGLPNAPGMVSNVECADLSGNALYVSLSVRTQGSRVEVYEVEQHAQTPAEVFPFTNGNCAAQPPSSEAFHTQFASNSGSGEGDCFTAADGAFGFAWTFGRSSFTAAGELYVTGVEWEAAYEQWLADRDLVLNKPVPRSLFTR
jgi:hypothetical protein